MLHSRFGQRSSLVAAAVTTACLAFTGAAEAAIPGDLCQIGNPNGADVAYSGGGGGIGFYHLNFGAYFRVDAYGDSTHYVGHGTSKPEGSLLRSDINQNTCH